MAKKKQTPPDPYDLFGEIPVTWPEIRRWMRRHTRFDPDSFRGRTYARQWNVADKIRAEKAAAAQTEPPLRGRD